jgi:protein gp37
MSGKSSIEWTDATWNPVTGCTKISPGCKHCYAETLAERFRGVPGHPYEQGFDLRLWPDRLELPIRWRKPRLIFVNSMSDLFHEDVPDEFIDRVFTTMIEAKWHVYQVLTKRPARMAAYVKRKTSEDGWRLADQHPQIWLGTSVESQGYTWRADLLRDIPVAVRFLSCEPLLGALDLSSLLDALDWVIVGGESGPGARPMESTWVREIRGECLAAGVPFFFKQWGGVRKGRTGRVLDGRTWDELPRVEHARMAWSGR